MDISLDSSISNLMKIITPLMILKSEKALLKLDFKILFLDLIYH
jgi:hypothetical protein